MTEEYVPLDLSPWCTVGSEILGQSPAIGVGSRSWNGLPFEVSGSQASDGASFILLEPGRSEVTVAIGRPASRVLVAHRRLPGDSSPTIGDAVAEYEFRIDGSDPIQVPIRERFEIGEIASEWSEWASPFVAVVGATRELQDRYRGPWEAAGGRQLQIPYDWEHPEVFLWAWENPKTDASLISIGMRSVDHPILVAAITISSADEEPFLREGARPIRVSMLAAERPTTADKLRIEADRGIVGYAYALPDDDLDGFLSDPLPGFGQPIDRETRHAYAKLAAVPSATVTVFGDDAELARFRWGDVVESGAAVDRDVRIEIVEPGKTWVHVRVVDEESGQPVPCRVHFRSLEGVPYQPHGHHDHVNSDLGTWHIDVGGDMRLGRLTYAYTDGTCQGWLPTGEIVVDVARGFEYEPLREKVSIEPGQRELTLTLRRMTSMNARGWYSGDSHVHFLSTQGALMEQQAEDLNVVNLLQSQWGSLFTNTEDYTGRPHATDDGRYVTFASQENRQHFLGHLTLWGLRTPVMPWCTDGLGEGELGGTLESTESDWADRCHEQGGTVVIPHFPNPNGEPAVLIATGRADAVEMILQHRRFHEEYYRYLNGGYRLPLVGGTDKMSNEVPVGLYRTYARLDDEFTYEGWCRAVRDGRTFLSGGPLLSFEVDGHEIGDTVPISGPGTVSVSAVAESIFPVSSLELVHNGHVVAASTEANGAKRLDLATDVQIEGDSWLAVRCGGPSHFDGPTHRDEWGRGLFSHTSPIYVSTQDEWAMFDADHARYMLTLIEGGLAYMRERAARYPTDRIAHHHGELDHVAYLERPFLEARKLVEARMEEAGP